MADNTFVVPTVDGFMDIAARQSYLSQYRTCRLEVAEYERPGSDLLVWKFARVIQGRNKEEKIGKAIEVAEQLNARHVRLLISDDASRGSARYRAHRTVVWQQDVGQD